MRRSSVVAVDARRSAGLYRTCVELSRFSSRASFIGCLLVPSTAGDPLFGKLQKIHSLLYVLSAWLDVMVKWLLKMWELSVKRIRGENMRFEYYIAGAVALVVIAAGITMLPDFIRYMKIRSM